jgi:hypothetical protein
MTEFTSEEIDQLRAVVGVIKAHPDCAKELQKLLSKPEVAYKPWNPDGKSFYWVSMCGDVMHEAGNASLQRENFNCFASVETAKKAAADAKIRNLFWQWKEQNDPAPANSGSYRIDYEITANGPRYGQFVIDCATYLTGLLYPFSSHEKASQFLAECKPYLDEYAKSMGWMNDGD